MKLNIEDVISTTFPFLECDIKRPFNDRNVIVIDGRIPIYQKSVRKSWLNVHRWRVDRQESSSMGKMTLPFWRNQRTKRDDEIRVSEKANTATRKESDEKKKKHFNHKWSQDVEILNSLNIESLILFPSLLLVEESLWIAQRVVVIAKGKRGLRTTSRRFKAVAAKNSFPTQTGFGRSNSRFKSLTRSPQNTRWKSQFK